MNIWFGIGYNDIIYNNLEWLEYFRADNHGNKTSTYENAQILSRQCQSPHDNLII